MDHDQWNTLTFLIFKNKMGKIIFLCRFRMFFSFSITCIYSAYTPVISVSKFHENREKPISRNLDKGVFFTWNFVKPQKRGIFWKRILSFLDICQLSIVFNEHVNVQYTTMLERVFLEKLKQTNCLCIMNFWIFINIVKSHHLNICLVFLKIGVFWKVLTFFLISKKKLCFKELKISWFHRKKGYFFPNNFLKRGHILHARTHMCTHFFYESPRRDPSLYCVLRACIPRLHNTGMATEITGKWSYYSVPIVIGSLNVKQFFDWLKLEVAYRLYPVCTLKHSE